MTLHFHSTSMIQVRISSLKVAFLPFCLAVVLLTGCQPTADDPKPTAQENAQSRLMKDFLGNYTVDGVYARQLLDPHPLRINQTSPTEWELNGTGYPAFKITKPYKAFQSGTNPGEYTLIAQSVGPDEGSVFFSSPDKMVTIAVDLTTASGKKFLTLTGGKTP